MLCLTADFALIFCYFVKEFEPYEVNRFMLVHRHVVYMCITHFLGK